MERLRVFQVVNRAVVERSAIYAEAVEVMTERYPCLMQGAFVAASGLRWSEDGRRIMLVAYARPDACQVPRDIGPEAARQWEPLLMIGEVESGRIEAGSVRPRRNRLGPMPSDGPYASL